jgi:hypothetical protein
MHRRRVLVMWQLVTLVVWGFLAAAPAAAQATGPFNVRTGFGAVGNGVADDTASIQNAINAAQLVGGGEVYLPAGTYRITNQLTVTNKSMAFRGEGQRLTTLRFEAALGIVFTSTAPPTPPFPINATLTVKSLSLLRSGAGGTAISATWPQYDPNAFGYVTTVINDVHIGEFPFKGGGYWDIGIYLKNATMAKISQFTIHGTSSSTGIAAIQLDGQSISHEISDGDIIGYTRGIEVKGTSEGTKISNIEAIVTRWGFVLRDFGPGTSISNCHLLSSEIGIDIQNKTDISVTNSLIYKLQGFNYTFSGIRILNGGRHRIANNLIIRPGPLDSWMSGIVIEGTAYDNVIQGNITSGMNVGIWLINSTVTGTMVIGNTHKAFANAAAWYNGSSNFVPPGTNNPL